MTKKRAGDESTPRLEALEQLYASEPEEFVAERTRLARELRDGGDPEGAADVAARKKPTLPVFAANRLARTRADDVAKLIEAAERVAKAHESGRREDVRAAQADLGDRLGELVHEAGEAAGRPLSQPAEQRLATLLRAAAVDPELATQLRRGILAEETEPAGFDSLLGLTLAPASSRASGRKADAGSRRAEERTARTAQLERDLTDARAALRDAEQELTAAQRQAERGRRRVADLEERLERARAAIRPR